MQHVNGWQLPDEDRHFISHFVTHGGFQLERLEALLTYCKNKSVAIDGGAHVGSWSKRMAQDFDRVLSFEPAPDTFECLYENLNNIENITLYNAALGDKMARVGMHNEERYRIAGNTGARYVQPGGDISMITIDDLNLTDCGLIKLDVEGAEIIALEGAEKTIKRFRPVVFIEVKKGFAQRFGRGQNDAIDFLVGMGAKLALRIKADHVFTFD